MKNRPHRSLWQILWSTTIGLYVLSFSLNARADQVTAQALFEAATDARDTGDMKTACEKFEASNDMDEAPGTILNIADCREQLGQLAQAWQRYTEAAEKLPASDPRASYAASRAEELRPRVPTVELVWPDVPQGASVVADGKRLPKSAIGVALPVDPGTHSYEVSHDGYAPFTTEATVAEGEHIEVTLQLGEPATAAAPAAAVAKESRVSSGGVTESNAKPHTMRTLGYVSLGVGAAGLIVGGITGGMTLAKAKTVKEDCLDDFCRTQAGKDAADQGKTLSAVSTASFIVGGVLLATGVTLVILGKPQSERVASQPSYELTLHPGSDGGALSFAGTF